MEAPQHASTPLADFGIMRYEMYMRPPAARRVASLVSTLFEQFEQEVPDLTLQILAYSDFEEELAKDAAGSAWRYWLASFRKSNSLAFAFVNREQMDQGKLLISMWQYSDRQMIHECLHFILYRSTKDEGLANSEQLVSVLVVQYMTSPQYRDWLRDRPWA